MAETIEKEDHAITNARGYGYGHGWELETCEETGTAIRERLKEYRENAPEYRYKITGPHRVSLEELEREQCHHKA